MKKTILAFLSFLVLLTACDNKKEVPTTTKSGLDPAGFAGTVDNKKNELHVLKNSKGVEVCVINFGARIVSVMVPDKGGVMRDVVLGFDSLQGYTSNRTDFGAAIGRYANRIGNAEFMLNRVKYTLKKNNGKNALHGGPRGFQYQMFDIEQPDSTTLICSYLSKNEEEGYPGNLNVTVTYKLTEDNAIDISYKATTDQATVINLTNHSYFNLSGDPNNTILDHIVYMDCDNYTPTTEDLIPTGKIESALNTPLDFKSPTVIGTRIDDTTFTAIKYGLGYDHNFIFNKWGDVSNLGCKVVCPSTGISLEVYTIEPAVQFYTGNFLDGTVTGKKGIAYKKRTGFCMETQHYPDSPNHPEFPSTVLAKDSIYTSRCIYKFGVEK